MCRQAAERYTRFTSCILESLHELPWRHVQPSVNQAGLQRARVVKVIFRAAESELISASSLLLFLIVFHYGGRQMRFGKRMTRSSCCWQQETAAPAGSRSGLSNSRTSELPLLAAGGDCSSNYQAMPPNGSCEPRHTCDFFLRGRRLKLIDFGD